MTLFRREKKDTFSGQSDSELNDKLAELNGHINSYKKHAQETVAALHAGKISGPEYTRHMQFLEQNRDTLVPKRDKLLEAIDRRSRAMGRSALDE